MKKAKNILVRFLKSKVAVFLVLLGILGVGLTQAAKADGNYNFATVYQYYMLDNRADTLKSQGGEQKIANVAPLGSGGVTGNFSYNEIVNSAPKGKGNEQAAKDFVSMMATYSAFKYFSNKVQGFESIVSYIGRACTMLVLLPFSLAMDIVVTLYPALIKIMAKLNIIPLLGAALTNLSIKSGLMEAAGFNKADVNNFINACLAIACSFIVIALGMSLRHGGQHIDRKWWRKFKGRVFMVLCFPLVIGFGATLLNSINDMVKTVPEMNSSFQKYLVDDRSWAYKYNFAPQGSSAQGSDIKPGNKGFVDLDFDPYTRKGADRILQINKGSDVAGDGNLFPNTSLLLAYGVADSFSAADYINYQGSKESSGNTYGSYYNYANTFSDKQLLDVDKAYYPSGGTTGVKDDQTGSYKSAIDDYKGGKDKKSLNTSRQIAWRDRFIYGAKTAGALDKYYGDTPSQEMVKNQVGGLKARNVPSDQSMFLILSTIFTENGGRYYINAPARGIKSVQGMFDSNRSDYFTVSMVGNPFFTFIGLISEPLITLTVLTAAIVALFSIGLLDMNLRPLSAAGKGFVLGDMEYGGAFMMYSLGIAGTWLLFIGLPTIIITVVQALAKSLITIPTNLANMHPSSPQQSLALNGVPIVMSGIVSVVFGLMWLKSPKFRYLLNDLFTFVWNWAKAAADRLERQAAGQDVSAAQRYAKEGHKRNKVLQGMNRADDLARNAGRSVLRAGLTKGLGLDFDTAKDIIPSEHDDPDADNNAPVDSANVENDDDSGETGNYNRPNSSKGSKSSEDIRRDGQFDRIHNALSDIQDSDKTDEDDPDYPLDTDNAVEDSKDAIEAFRHDPTQENLENAQDRLMALKNHLVDSDAPQDQIDDVDKAMNELNDVGRGYGLDPDRIGNKAIESDNVENRQNNDDNTPNNIVSDHEKPKIIDEVANNADKALRNIQNDPKTPRDTIDNVLASENAVDNFRNNPTPENLQAAKGQLEALKKQLIASGAPQDQINDIDKAIDGLNKAGIDNGFTQNTNRLVESDNLEPKEAANNADKALRNIQNDPKTPRDTIDDVLASENAIDNFRNNPTPENLQAAKGQLEALKRQAIASGTPKEQVANVDKAIDGLNKVGQKPTPTQNVRINRETVQSNNLDPKRSVAVADNADNALRTLQSNPQISRSVLASRKAINGFKNNPTPQNLQAAKSQLEALKRQAIASGTPKEQVANVDKAIDRLNKVGQKPTPTQNVRINRETVQSNNLDPKRSVAVVDNADNALRTLQSNPQVSRSVLASRKAINGFKNNPTPQNLQAAKSQLEALKKQAIVSGAPKEQVRTINKVINGLNGTGRTQNVIQNTGTHNSVIRSNTVTKTPTQKVIDKVINTQTQAPQNSRPIVRHHVQKAISNSNNLQTKRPVLDVNDKENIEKVTTQKVMRPVINGRLTRVVSDNQLRGVISSLGPVAQNKSVAEPLRQLRHSENIAEVKKNVRKLQKAVRALNQSSKRKIDKKAFVDNLYNLQKPKNLGGNIND